MAKTCSEARLAGGHDRCAAKSNLLGFDLVQGKQMQFDRSESLARRPASAVEARADAPASAPARICFYSPASRGGAGWFVFALAQALADAGAQLHLIAPIAVPAEREPRHRNITRDILVAGKAGKAPLIVRTGLTLWRIASTFPALLRGRFAAREFVITMFDWVLVLVAQMLWLRLLGAQITFVVHDATPHAWAFPTRLQGIERWLYRLSYRLPKRIVTLTRAAHRELAAHWQRVDRSWVIPHGAYVHGVPEPMPGNDVVLIFGMLRRNKRILESIEAFKRVRGRHPSLRLMIAGAPHAEDYGYWHECEAAIAGHKDRIETEIGFVPEARLEQLMAECDAVLLPYEAFSSQSGVAVLASFAERLLVATDAGGIGELMQDGLEPVTIARPVTVESVTDAFDAFMATPLDKRRRMARVTREKLESLLAWDGIGRDYVALIGAG